MTHDNRLNDIIWTADAVIDSGYEHVTIGATDWKIISSAIKDIEPIAAMRERAAARVAAFKDLDGSTGEQYDNGYCDGHNDALTAIRSLPIEQDRKP